MSSEKTGLPPTMRAWQYRRTTGSLPPNLHLNPTTPLPTPKKHEHLIRILHASTNPMDYKPAETPIHHLLIPKPATPGSDFSGLVITPAPNSSLQPGDLVFGAAQNTLAGGTMAEYICVPAFNVAVIPPGVSARDAAALPMAAITAWQSTVPFISSSSYSAHSATKTTSKVPSPPPPPPRIFINGASGGVGTFAVQFAKLAGAHVTAACSAANMDLVKSLGADEVLDYRASSTPLVRQLQRLAEEKGPFERVVDNVGTHELYWGMQTFAAPGAVYSYVGFGPSVGFVWFWVRAKLVPWGGFWGVGRKRKMEVFVAKRDVRLLEEIAELVGEGRVKVVVDEVFGFEDVPRAYERQKSGRARGKIVVEVGEEKGGFAGAV